MILVQPRADGRAQGDDEEECWEDHRQLYDSGNGGVGQAAVVAGGRSQDDSEDHHCNRREDRDLERDARSIEKAEKLVVTQDPVRPEHVELLAAGLTVTGGRIEVLAGDVCRRPDRKRLDAVLPGRLVDRGCAMAEVVLCDRAADNRDRSMRMMTTPLAIATLSRLNRIQTCSSSPCPDLDVGSELAVGLGRCYAGQARLRADELFTVWCAAHVGG